MTERNVHIVIFGKKDCPFCVKAKRLAEDIQGRVEGVTYRYIDIHEEGITRADLEKTVGKEVTTVPQVFLGQQHIGGHAEFKHYVDTHLADR